LLQMYDFRPSEAGLSILSLPGGIALAWQPVVLFSIQLQSVANGCVISDRHSIAQTPTSKQLFAHQHRQKLRRLFRDSVACQTQRERNKVYYQKTLTPPEAK
ncbi:hypothetical protein JTM21_37655, partial [Pseudomonas aeruginosa]|nr:hypothetical protein [Pseudomonas aeruginosa]